MKFKNALIGLSLVLCACNATSQEGWTVTVSGKVGFPGKGPIVIQEIRNYDETPGILDTIILNKDYTYSKELKLREPGYYRLTFFNKQRVDFILAKDDVEVNVDGNNAQGFVEVKGSPDMDLIQKVQDVLARVNVNPEAQRLRAKFSELQAVGDEAAMDSILAAYQAVVKVQKDSVAGILSEHEPSLAAINLLMSGQVLDREDYLDVYTAVASKLTGEWRTYSHAQEYLKMVDRMKTVAVGQMAPEITLPNPKGDIVKLSSLRGKYVLIDFWAKWCGPCRQENPNLVRAYNRYKGEGFEIFGVSLDRTKDDWLQAIRDDNLTWTHVSDLKYWDSEAAKAYNVQAIPFSVLLDPEGKIIAKNLRGAELEEKLAEIFGG